MQKTSKIFVAGHSGLLGSAIVRVLQQMSYSRIIVRTHAELDLTNQNAVEQFFSQEKPEYVFLSAAKVGGILANSTYPAEFIYTNLAIATNVIHASYTHGVKKLLNLGSSCIYPRDAPQPIKEEYLLSGKLESTNEPYAIAKIAAIKLCQYYRAQYESAFISAMPSNLYGIGDNFSPHLSHVLPAIIRKCHDAKEEHKDSVTLWGDGSPRREFLFSDDAADACVFLMNHENIDDIGSHINIGTGKDIDIGTLARIVADIVQFKGEFIWDTSKPNGTLQKCTDISLIKALGWKAKISLTQGIQKTYEWFLHAHEYRGKEKP